MDKKLWRKCGCKKPYPCICKNIPNENQPKISGATNKFLSEHFSELGKKSWAARKKKILAERN